MESVVAFASDRKEFETVLGFAKKRKDANVKCICLDFWPGEGPFDGNVRVFKERAFVSGKELDSVRKKALFFSRNWYRFDKSFEQEVRIRGISLGFVSDFAIYNLFELSFLSISSGINAAKQWKAKTFVAVKGSFAGECAKAAAEAVGAEFKGIDGGKARGVNRHVNFNRKKLAELQKKAFAILKESGKGKGRLVFVKSNGYLDGLSEQLGSRAGFSVNSLDSLVARKLLWPWNAAKFEVAKKEKRVFFSRLFRELAKKPGFGKRMVFNGFNFAEVFFRFMPRFIERDWPEFVFLIELLWKEFEEKKPCAVVVWEDWIPFERICVLVARKFNAKSLVVQHGLFKAGTNLPDFVRGFAPVVADRIAVWGPHFKRVLEAKKVPGRKIIVTGCPRLDVLHDGNSDALSFGKGSVVFGETNLVLLATQPPTGGGDSRLELASAAIAAVKRIKNAKLVIKAHPLENKEDYAKLVAGARGKALLSGKTNLRQLLKRADAVITPSFAVGLEAMALRRPVIIYAKRQVALEGFEGIVAENGYMLKELLEGILTEKKGKKAGEKRVEEFIYDFGFKQDGGATDRVIELLKGQDL